MKLEEVRERVMHFLPNKLKGLSLHNITHGELVSACYEFLRDINGVEATTDQAEKMADSLLEMEHKKTKI